MHREKPGPGQESVWDYPRPPRLEASAKIIGVFLAGELIAESSGAFRVLETSHPPTWYIPAADVRMNLLVPANKTSFCEWKGRATYWNVSAAGHTVDNSVWSYESPSPNFVPIKGHLAFYPSRFECYVDEERVTAQSGDFYGGWITHDIVGPFKGTPGSWGW